MTTTVPDSAAVSEHIALARAARQKADGKAVAHHLRNAGAVLAQIGQAAAEAKGAKVTCSECGRSSIENPPAMKDKMHRQNIRRAWREAKSEMGVDAGCSGVEARDNEGRLYDYGLVVRDENPNG